MKRKKSIILAVTILFVFSLVGNDKKRDILNTLIKQNRFQEAENYCRKQKKKNRKEYWRILADAFYEEGNLKKASEYYKKSEYKKGFNKIAAYFFKNDDYNNAIKYYEQGIPSRERAIAFETMADNLKKEKNQLLSAKSFFIKAIQDYEFMLKRFNYTWKNDYYADLNRCIKKRETIPKNKEEKVNQAKLNLILKKTAEYCRRLKTSAFHFFCKEEISERIDVTKKIGDRTPFTPGSQRDRYSGGVGAQTPTAPFSLDQSSSERILDNKYLYEYQLLKEDENIQETRILLKRNGIKKNVKNADLELRAYRYTKLIFGPIALLSQFWQSYHHYKILREENLNGEKAVVIESIPIKFSKENPLFGKIWVKGDDFSILKIEWTPKSMGFSQQIREISRKYQAEPDITFFEEFNIEKNNIRFPSRYYIEEAYMTEKGKRFVRVKQNVILKDYMFFTVGTEVVETSVK